MNFKTTLLISSTLMALSPMLAFAQSTSPTAPTVAVETEAQRIAREAREAAVSPETIIVTATRRGEQAIKVPYNISAISEEQLRDGNITDIKDLLRDNVAIAAPQNSARFNDSVTVRGLNVSPVNANNLDYFVRST